MRIAVVQHRVRATPSDDAAALADAATRAVSEGADVVVLPDVRSLDRDESVRVSLERRLASLAVHCLRSTPVTPSRGDRYHASVSEGVGSEPALGRVVVLVGDACITPTELAAAHADKPAAAVLSPGSENDLQSESFLELAIALSNSLTGLVIVAECVGAEPGEPGHGGSAIVLLGQVMAEALGEDEVIFADITVPVATPEPPEPLPEIPLLLRQRLAFHAGRKVEVSGYLSDIG